MAQRPVSSLNTREYDDLIAFLRKVRNEKNVSQEELSRRLGQAQNYILKVEHKDRRLDLVEFVFIAQKLGISPKRLFSDFIDVLRPLEGAPNDSED